MNEVSTTEAVRGIASSSRKDAAAASNTASTGQSDGRSLPQERIDDVARDVRESVERNAQSQEKVERAVQSLNSYAQSFQRDLEFSVDEELGRPIVHVVDRNTQEVIRQIPNDVALRLARNLQSHQALQQSPDLGADPFGASSANRLGLVNTKV